MGKKKVPSHFHICVVLKGPSSTKERTAQCIAIYCNVLQCNVFAIPFMYRYDFKSGFAVMPSPWDPLNAERVCNKLPAGRLRSISTLHVGPDQPYPRPNSTACFDGIK